MAATSFSLDDVNGMLGGAVATPPAPTGSISLDDVNAMLSPPSARDEDSSEFWKGLVGTTISQNPEAAAATFQAYGNIFGSDWLRETGRRVAEGRARAGEAYRPRVGSIDQIRTDSIGNFVDDATDWLSYGVGSGLASTVPSVVGGVGGALAGGALAGPPGAAVGAAAGALAPGYALNTGDLFKELVDAGVPEDRASKIAAAVGVPLSALDAVLGSRFGNLLTGGAKDEIAKKLRQRIVREFAKGAKTEAVTEAAQEAIQAGTVAAETGQPFLTRETAARVGGAGLIGGVTGGIVGGVGGALARPSRAQQPAALTEATPIAPEPAPQPGSTPQPAPTPESAPAAAAPEPAPMERPEVNEPAILTGPDGRQMRGVVEEYDELESGATVIRFRTEDGLVIDGIQLGPMQVTRDVSRETNIPEQAPQQVTPKTPTTAGDQFFASEGRPKQARRLALRVQQRLEQDPALAGRLRVTEATPGLWGIRVTGATPEDAAKVRAEIERQIQMRNAAADRARAKPRARTGAVGLLEALANAGGLKATGDLIAMDAHLWHRPFARKLIHQPGEPGYEKAMTLDEAREWAEERGYIGAGGWMQQETDINTLLDAIDRELRGAPVYDVNTAAEAAEAEKLRRAPDENRYRMEQRAAELGIEYGAETPDDELIRAIEQAEERRAKASDEITAEELDALADDIERAAIQAEASLDAAPEEADDDIPFEPIQDDLGDGEQHEGGRPFEARGEPETAPEPPETVAGTEPVSAQAEGAGEPAGDAEGRRPPAPAGVEQGGEVDRPRGPLTRDDPRLWEVARELLRLSQVLERTHPAFAKRLQRFRLALHAANVSNEDFLQELFNLSNALSLIDASGARSPALQDLERLVNRLERLQDEAIMRDLERARSEREQRAAPTTERTQAVAPINFTDEVFEDPDSFASVQDAIAARFGLTPTGQGDAFDASGKRLYGDDARGFRSRYYKTAEGASVRISNHGAVNISSRTVDISIEFGDAAVTVTAYPFGVFGQKGQEIFKLVLERDESAEEAAAYNAKYPNQVLKFVAFDGDQDAFNRGVEKAIADAIAAHNATRSRRTQTVERTEAGEQTVIPGAERISDKELAERRMEERMRPAVPQQPADEGLFDIGARQQGDLLDAINRAAAEADPTPTEGQKEAGNYRKGHVRLHGLDITIETAKGEERSGTNRDGKPWSVRMPAHYGYIRRTEGSDGEQVDVYLGDNPEAETVYVVDQIDPERGTFDEHKVLLGFGSRFEALVVYDAAFSDGSGPSRRGAVTPFTIDEFKEWLRSGDTTKPLAWKPGGPDLPDMPLHRRIYEALLAHFAAGKTVTLPSHTRPRVLSSPEHIRLARDGMYVIRGYRQDGRPTWDFLAFTDVHHLARQVGLEDINIHDLARERAAVTEVIGPMGDMEPVFVESAQPREVGETATGDRPLVAVARRVAEALREGTPVTQKRLQDFGAEVFGGSLAEGTFQRKDLYDALELGVNLYIRDRGLDPRADLTAAKAAAEELDALVDRLPRQSARSQEQQLFQQFSTPPNYAYAVAWAANIRPGETMLEPSAGTGNIAVHAMNAGAEVVVNELAPRRAELLRALGPARVFTENAEQLHNILPDEVRPTVVVMNPPFSQTAGRMGDRKDLMVGAQHVEQALNRLAPGGRLVAIVGRGMGMDAARFRDFWRRVSGAYDVRANVLVDGKVYGKFGTEFDTRVLVIDKVPPKPGRAIVDGAVASVSELIERLQEVRNDRPEPQRDTRGERSAAQPSRARPAQAGEAEQPAGRGAARPGAGGVGAGEGGRDRGLRREPAGPATGAGEPAVRSSTGGPAAVVDQQPQRPEPAGAGGEPDARDRGRADARERGGVGARGDQQPVGGEQPGVPAGDAGAVGVEDTGPTAQTGELSDSIFEAYQPQRVRIEGAKPHPGPLVQSAAMASVMPPAPTYQPRIPKALIAQGALSLAQLEAVVYAGQAHEKMLPAGENETPRRRGFFIGDGTGVGKGREIAGIILDNWNQGRTKAIWISEKKTLLNDAKRDWSGLGQDPRLIFDLGKVKAGERITAARGILFSTYDTLKGGLTDQKSAVTGKFVKGQRVRFNLPETGWREGVIAATNPVGPRRAPSYRVRVGDETIEVPVDALTALDETPKIATRVQQIVDWVGSDFDGVIAFDESHNMANAVATKGARGMKDAAAKALAGLELQRLLPNARVVYVSATGATEVSNLAYAERLGLWGRGTPFATMEDFITKVSQGGIAAMELIARDMKALGLYIARNLSYDGVEYDRIEHRLTDAQREIYDALAEAWQVVLRNIHRALEITGGSKNPRAKSAAMSAFWGAHQRFFNQIITSMQMPSVLKAIEQDLKEGRQAVLQIVNTNEASQERAAAKIQSAEDLEDLDITPRDQIIQLVEHSFPTQQFEEYVDEDGNVRSRPVVDSEGNPVENKEAVALRDELIDRLASIRVPQGPLEMLLDHFGVDQVAEVTGRKRRFVLKPDPATGEMRRVEEMRPASANVSEVDLFQAGKKKILIFSDAGGTGRSYHADNTAPSKNARRAHYLVQAGWRADKAIQGFGRTHRTNQASAPIFRLVTTDLKGQKRFISSIARRLAQLGALTKGQRQAADQGVFSARDNLESTEARDALRQFYHALARGGIPGVSVAEFEEQTGLSLFDKDGGGLRQQLPPIEQFLNRLLSLKIDMQAKVFDAFEEILNDIIEAKRQAGTLDIGLETIRADKVEKVSERTVYTDPESGAETKYVRIKLSNRLKATPFDKLLSGRGEPEFFAKSPRGKFYAVYKAPSLTAEDGSVIDQYRLVEPSGSHLIERERIDGPKAQGWQKITGRDEAAKLWQQEIERLPPFIVQDLHLITGAVLPIWDRLGGHPRVVRLQTDAGERFLGRVVPSSEIAGTLKALGAEADAPQIDPAEAVQRILDDGQTAVLSNGWTIQRRMVAGEPRIEIRGPQTFGEGRELQRDGVFIERIEFRNRYFIPTGENAARVLAAVTKYRPIVEMRSSGGPRLGALGADGGIRLSPARQTHRAKIIAAIIDEMRKIAPYANLELVESARDIALQFPESMRRTGIDASGADRVFGYYMNGTVSLAMSVLEQYPPRVARAAVRHEAGIHFLKDTGFILPQEWALLERAARENGWLEEYGVPDVEEAVAYKIMFWRPETNREAGAVARILKKIREFFVRLGNALRGMGFQTWQDVFERILSGEVGARTPAVRLDALRPKLGFLTREAAEEVARREEEATGLAWVVSKYRTLDGKTRWRVTTYMVPITATGRQLTERQRRYLEAIGVLSPSQSTAAAAEFNIGNRKPFQPSEQRAPKDVRRGAQAIIERLQLQVAADRAFNQRAAKAGKETRAPLTHDDVREIDDFIRFVGEEMFGDVGLSIRADKGPQGQFNYASAIVTIYRKAIQQGLFSRTTVHELWHALERALPAKDRDAVIKAWERAVARYARANPWYAAFRNTRHLTGRAAEQFRKDHPEALQRDDIVDLGDEGVMLMNTEENYRLVNADEFFAETMADRYFDRRRQEAQELRSLWAHAVGVVRRMVAGFMRRFGYDPMGRIFETYASRGYAPPRPLSESITGEAVSFAKKDYDRLKYRLAEAAKRAAEQVAGREQVPENVRVEQPKVNRDLNALKVPFWVPSSLFKDWAPLQQYVLRASKRMQAMSAALTRLRERWDNIVKPLSQEQFGELTAILFEGDIEQTVYTPEELATRGASEPVIEAYGKARRFFDVLGRLVDQHERAMRPTLRRAKLLMLGKLRKASPLSAEELDRLLNHRILLRARLRAAEDVDAAKALMAELAEIDARLGFDADPNTEDEFSKLLQGIDRIDDQLARTSVRRIKGYVPHKFFGSWALYELVEVEEAGEKRTERRLVPAPATGFLPSRTAALEWARKVAADRGPEARFVVAPVRVGLATESSLTLPRPRYEALLTRLQNAFGLTPEEVRENVREAGIKPRSGRRTASFKQRRNWVEGHSRDLARVIDTHIGEVVRYVHLDTLKYEAMILEDRLGLQPDRREVRTLTDAFQAYVRDVLGQKQPLEARIDELFERPWAQPLQVGLASGIGTFLLAGGISSNPFVPLLLGSLVGYRMYVARRKSGEIGAFHSRSLTGEALNVVSHLKLGAFFNLFSAVVNLTQLPLNTLSVLPASAVANGIRRYMTAVASGVRGKPNHDLRLLQRHNVDPVYKFSEVSPHLYDRPGMIERASMFAFDNVEKFNRAVTFLAAYYHALSLDPEAAGRAVDAWAKRENADLARFRSAQLGPDGKFTTGGAQRFAAHTMTRTQFDMSAAMRPALLRNVFARVPLQFKNFMIQQTAFVVGLDRKEELPRFLLSMFLVAGVLGLPGIQLLDGLLDWLFGISPIEEVKRAALKAAAYGDLAGDIAYAIARGLPAFIGWDISSRTGMGESFLPKFTINDLIGPGPGTVLKARELAERNASLADQLRNLAPGLGAPLKSLEAAANGLPVETMLTDPASFFAALGDERAVLTSPWKRGAPELPDRALSSGQLVLMAVGGTPAELTRLRDFTAVTEAAREDYRQELQRAHDRIGQAYTRYFHTDPGRFLREVAEVQEQFSLKTGYTLTRESIRAVIRNQALARDQRSLRSLPRQLRPEAMELQRGIMGVE